MPKKTKTKSVSKDLLSFRTSTSPALPSTTHNNHGLRQRSNKTNHKSSKKQWQERKERLARQQLQSSFFLHSSSSHSFVIKRQQYAEQLDADSVLSWDNVLLVKNLVPSNISSDSSTTSCSICLSEFVSPRITPCGHTYCYGCILNHIYSSEKAKNHHNPSAKCPCCSHRFERYELRPVSIISVHTPKPNGVMCFQKVHRATECLAPFVPISTMIPSSTLAHDHPAGSHDRKVGDHSLDTMKGIKVRRGGMSAIPTMSSNEIDAPFCRYNYVDMFSHLSHLQHDISCLNRELEHLRDLYKNYRGKAAFDDATMYVSMALQSVEAEYEISVVELEQELALQQSYEAEQQRYWKHDAKEEKEKDQKTTRNHSQGSEYLHDGCVQFYQSTDGQLCFLSAFNIKCLSYQYAETEPVTKESEHFDSIPPPFPDQISGNIIEVETVHVTPDIRKRMPFLHHVPLYTDISLVEIDLGRVLSSNTREHFKVEIESRRKKRQAKKRKQKKSERARKEEEEGKYRAFHSLPSATIGAVDDSTDAFDDFAHGIVPVKNPMPPDTPSSQSYSSFRSVCASNGLFPPLESSNQTK